MHENQSEQFELIPAVDGERDSRGRLVHVPEPGNGRPTGGHNSDKKIAWKLAHNATPSIMQKMIELAQHPETELGFKAAALILSRTFPKPRNAPILGVELSMDRTNPSTIMERLLQALDAGELTAPDVATLARVFEHSALPSAAADTAEDSRALLLERINRVIEEKKRRTISAPAAAISAVPDPIPAPAIDEELAEMEKQILELERRRV